MSGTVNAPFGMRPLEMWDGSPWNGATRNFVTETSNDAIFVGDPLYRVVGDAEETTARFMAVDQLTGATGAVNGVDDQILGVMVSHEGQFPNAGAGGVPDLLQSDSIYVPGAASPAYLLNVVCDNAVVYLIQGDEASTDYKDCGKNCSIVSGSGSTVTGLSGFVMDISAAAAAANLSNLLIGLLDVPGNAIGDTYALWMVAIGIGYFQPGGYDPILGTLGI